MREIRSQVELNEMRKQGRGLIYNDFSGHGAGGANWNVLHAADCRTLARANMAVPKFFFSTVSEATNWLERNRGPEGIAWKRCGTCGAAANS
jgi:hypothetical protein